MTTYAEKLRDPRWQRKRLEVMQRDGFACTVCGNDGETLNVHHGYYERGLDPWEYDIRTLWTLCHTCHEEIQDGMRVVQKAIAMIPPEVGATFWKASNIDMFNSRIRAFAACLENSVLVVAAEESEVKHA